MTRRFWISLALTVPLVLLSMAEMVPGLVPASILTRPWPRLDAACPGGAGGSLGWLAVLRAGLAVCRSAEI